jgi:hypothetical protein
MMPHKKDPMDERTLRIESEHAQFVAKCIYERACDEAIECPSGDYVELSKLKEICQQSRAEPKQMTAEQMVEKLTEYCEQISPEIDASKFENTYGFTKAARMLLAYAESLIQKQGENKESVSSRREDEK